MQIVVFSFHYYNVTKNETTIKQHHFTQQQHTIISPFQGLCYSGGGDGCYKRFALSGLKCVLVITHLAIYV
ncbi:MAG: hypothetical protein JNM36_00075 [Chitinophagales bacterium]|nr:hypothetical protein [Chitinophagales bacterium]